MAKYVGRRRAVGIALEGSRGVAETTPTFGLRDTNYALQERQMRSVAGGAIGRIEANYYAEIAQQWAEGEIQMPVEDRTIGAILKALLGASSPSANGTAYNHAITVDNTNAHPSLTVFLDDPALGDLRFANGMIDSFDLKIDADKEDYLETTIGLMGKSPVTGSFNVPLVVQNQFRARDASVKLADSISGLAGASAIVLAGISLSIKKNIFKQPQLGSVDPADFLNQQFTVEGSLTLHVSDATYWNLFLYNTKKALRLTLERSDVTISTGVHPLVQIDLARLDFSENDFDRGNDSIVKQTLNFRGHYSIADAKMISALVTNTQATY